MVAALLSIADDRPVETTLEAFLAENDFPDDDALDITSEVTTGGLYFGGGGAAPGWVIGSPPAVSAYLAEVGA